jgi:cell division protein FtsL
MTFIHVIQVLQLLVFVIAAVIITIASHKVRQSFRKTTAALDKILEDAKALDKQWKEFAGLLTEVQEMERRSRN